MGFRQSAHDRPPRYQPGRAGDAKHEEHRPPSERGKDRPANQRADRRAERERGRDHRIGKAAIFGRDVAANDLRAGREDDAFADAEHDPEKEQREEAADKPHQ